MNTELYTCSCNQIQKAETPKCQDCARYKYFYIKQSNGSYKPIKDDIGFCALRGYRNITDLVPYTREANDCKHFVPTNPDDFKRVWLRTPAN